MAKTKIRVAMTLENDLAEALMQEADREGFSTVTPVVRRFVLKGLKAEQPEGNIKTVSVKLDNYQEISRYVQEKKFGIVESFITYAVAQHMARYPLTEGQKKRIGKNIDNGALPR